MHPLTSIHEPDYLRAKEIYRKHKVKFPLLFADSEMEEVVYSVCVRTGMSAEEGLVIINSVLGTLSALNGLGIEYEIKNTMVCEQELEEWQKEYAQKNIDAIRQMLTEKRKNDLYSYLKFKLNYIFNKKKKKDANDRTESSKRERKPTPYKIWRAAYGL